MTNTERIRANNAELLECIEIAESLPDAGASEEVELQSKTVTPTTVPQEITADEGYDGLEKVTVEKIPSEYIVPSGTKSITANGTHDVTANASVEVNVPVPDGYIKPSGTLTVTENGEYDVTEKAGVVVDVPETEPVLQSKTVSPSTSAQTVKPDTGYDGLSQVTVNAMPAATQATPSITVGTDGKITASATQTAGYVSAGTKSATKQLTVQAAATITPSTSDQNAVSSGVYTTGAITVKGDANLKAENIKSGVSIFGVNGTNSGAEDLSAELTEYESLNTELEDVINSLPSAGGGSAIETCTVEFNDDGMAADCVYEISENGALSTVVRRFAGEALVFTDSRVVKGTQLVLVTMDYLTFDLEGSVTLVYDGSIGGWIGEYIYVLRVEGDCSISTG